MKRHDVYRRNKSLGQPGGCGIQVLIRGVAFGSISRSIRGNVNKEVT